MCAAAVKNPGSRSLKMGSDHDTSFLERLVTLDGMQEVEGLIKARLDSEVELLEAIPHYLLSVGGKRIRPLLALMMARAFGMSKPSSDLIDIAAGVELIHMATLLHDDIIDQAPLRRGKASALAKFGIDNTLLAGDFLFVRAFGLCSKLDEYIINATEDACVELTEGEVLESLFSWKEQANQRLDNCFTIARKKTAALFTLGALSAAHITENKPAIIEQARSFGENLGIAFQIVDDILDITSDEKTLGKERGSDLRHKKPSIINILWVNSASELAIKMFLSPDLTKQASDSELSLAIAEVEKSDIINQARQFALNYTTQAKKALTNALETSSSDPELIQNQAYSDLLELMELALSRVG